MTHNSEETGPLARFALALTDWTERWVPDAFVFALLATLIVVVAGVFATNSSLPAVIDAWGRGFWDLIPFTLQMALVIITGHVLATSRPIGRVIRTMAGWPRTPRGAVALVTAFTLAASWLNWGFSLVFGAVLAIEVARRVDGVDYRALASASVLGLGSIWAQGLSGSAALQMATPGALQPASASSARDARRHTTPLAGLPCSVPIMRHAPQPAGGAPPRGMTPVPTRSWPHAGQHSGCRSPRCAHTVCHSSSRGPATGGWPSAVRHTARASAWVG